MQYSRSGRKWVISGYSSRFVGTTSVTTPRARNTSADSRRMRNVPRVIHRKLDLGTPASVPRTRRDNENATEARDEVIQFGKWRLMTCHVAWELYGGSLTSVPRENASASYPIVCQSLLSSVFPFRIHVTVRVYFERNIMGVYKLMDIIMIMKTKTTFHILYV